MKRIIPKYKYLLAPVLLAISGQVLASTVNKGDANTDSEVNIGDVVAVVNHINDSEAGGDWDEVNADANGDNEINIGDVVGIVNIINNGKVEGSSTISGWTEGNSNEELEPLELETDETEDSYGD